MFVRIAHSQGTCCVFMGYVLRCFFDFLLCRECYFASRDVVHIHFILRFCQLVFLKSLWWTFGACRPK